MSQPLHQADLQTPPAASKPHAAWGTYAMRAVAVLAASTSFLLLVVRRPGSPIGITALAILFFVGFMGAVLAWGTRWKPWRSIVRAAGASAIATGLVMALLQILPAWTVTGDHAILDCSEPVIDRDSSYFGEPGTDAISLIIRYRDSRADVDKFPATHCPGGRHCQIDSK